MIKWNNGVLTRTRRINSALWSTLMGHGRRHNRASTTRTRSSDTLGDQITQIRNTLLELSNPSIDVLLGLLTSSIDVLRNTIKQGRQRLSITPRPLPTTLRLVTRRPCTTRIQCGTCRVLQRGIPSERDGPTTESTVAAHVIGICIIRLATSVIFFFEPLRGGMYLTPKGSPLSE